MEGMEAPFENALEVRVNAMAEATWNVLEIKRRKNDRKKSRDTRIIPKIGYVRRRLVNQSVESCKARWRCVDVVMAGVLI